MSEKTCPDCMVLGQQLEDAQLQIRQLEDAITELECRHREYIDQLDREHRDELQMAVADGYREAQQEAEVGW